MLRVRSPQDLGAGILFMLIGTIGLYNGWELTYGSAGSMGPGYFPIWLSWTIFGMGLICLFRSFALDGPAIQRVQIRPLFFVFFGVLLFGYLIEYIGMFFALILMILVATQARRDTNIKEVAVLSVVLAFGAVIVFVYILGQAMPAWWGR
jgi:hypothetical protein